MARKIKKTLILAKLETTQGTDAAPAAADALLISDATFSVEYDNKDRNLIRPTMGHGGTLVGTRHLKIDFSVELAGSGAAGDAPAWGRLLLACAFAETATPGQMVEYTPVSDALKSLTIKYSADGVIHTALGCMGTVTFDMTEGERPTLKFSFVGFDGGSQAAAAPTPNYTAWKMPHIVNTHNSGKLTFGGTYATGAITGGDSFCSKGLTLNMANDAKYLALLGCNSIDITDRKPAGSFALALPADKEVAMRAEINQNTPTSISLLHGTQAGEKVLLHIARAVRLNPKYEDSDGQLLLACDFNAEPVTGDDELRIVCL